MINYKMNQHPSIQSYENVRIYKQKRVHTQKHVMGKKNTIPIFLNGNCVVLPILVSYSTNEL